jgi:hypothetical protein
MISNPCIEVHTSVENRPSVPAWFAEVVILAGHLTEKGQMDAFGQEVRLVRGCFGKYEPIDFLGVLIGYAMSGERTLADFFARVMPFNMAFMALFGRKDLPHRATLSRFLADVDRPCLEAFRTLCEQQSFTDGWDAETTGGIFDRRGRRFMVFDVDATRQAVRQRALPGDPSLPTARRRFHLEKVLRAFPLLLVPHVQCARTAAGVGTIGSLKTRGGDHLNCVLPSLVFLLFSRRTYQGGSGEHPPFF